MERKKIGPGLYERVLATGVVRFDAYGRKGTREKYLGTFGTVEAAEEAREDNRSTQRRVRRGQLPPDVDDRRTFETAAKAWIASLENRRSRSAAGYGKRLELYLLKRLGDTPIMHIGKPHVVAIRDHYAGIYAPSTTNGIVTCLSAAFSYFVERGWVEHNPCRGVKAVEDPATAYNWIRTREEMQRLLVACDGALRPIVATALLTGMRLDEVLHLQWVDVDLARRLITVHRGRQGTVKSGKLRHVPILDALLPVLRAWKLQSGGSVLVFPVATGKVRTKQSVTAIYKLALRRAQLDETLRFHDLRHTFASHWMIDGGEIFKLSRVLGHADLKMTMRYAHLAPTAFEVDYGRLGIRVPTESAPIYDLQRDGKGRIVGRTSTVVTAYTDKEKSEKRQKAKMRRSN